MPLNLNAPLDNADQVFHVKHQCLTCLDWKEKLWVRFVHVGGKDGALGSRMGAVVMNASTQKTMMWLLAREQWGGVKATTL